MDWRREALGIEKPVRRPLQGPDWGTGVLALGTEKRGKLQRRSHRID